MALTKGLDISAAQGPSPDLARAKAAGFDFVICKASEGLGSDPTYQRNMNVAHAAGMLATPYHFASLQNDPRLEARHFVDAVAKGPPPDFPPAVDFEIQRSDDKLLPGHMTGDQALAWVSAFVEEALSQLSARGLGDFDALLLYSFPSYLRDLVGTAALQRSDVPKKTIGWFADYTRNLTAQGGPSDGMVPVMIDPRSQWFLPNTWPQKPPWFWQWVGDASGPTPGFPAAVDHDVFAGTVSDLKTLGRKGLAAVVASVVPVPAAPNALPTPVSAPVGNVVGGRAPLIAAFLAAVAGGAYWLFQHFFRR